MFNCNVPFTRCEVVCCTSSKTVFVLCTDAKMCHLGRKKVVHKEVSVPVKLIRHRVPVENNLFLFSEKQNVSIVGPCRKNKNRFARNEILSVKKLI